jgi:hypothetical protein
MKIGIFGHSIAIYNNHKTGDHYSQLVNAHFPEHTINWYGFFSSSLERIIYQVDRHKNLDLYVIFHTHKNNLYFPGWYRDLDDTTFFNALKSEVGWRRFLFSLRHGVNTGLVDPEKMKDFIKFYKDVMFDKRMMELRYNSNLFLLKSLLHGKKTIHVECSGLEKRIFKNDYFSSSLQPYTNMTHEYVDSNLLSKALIAELEQAINS